YGRSFAACNFWKASRSIRNASGATAAWPTTHPMPTALIPTHPRRAGARQWVSLEIMNHEVHEGTRRKPWKTKPSCPSWFMQLQCHITKLTHYPELTRLATTETNSHRGASDSD